MHSFRPRKGRDVNSRSLSGFEPGMGLPGGSIISKRQSGQHTGG
jgi:hypothetical protein